MSHAERSFGRRACGLLLALGCGLAGSALGPGVLRPVGASAEPAEAAPKGGTALRRPEAQAGPFRVALMRLTQNRRFAEGRERNDPEPKPIQVTQSLHLHLAVLASDPDAGARLETFQISDVTVGSERRSASLSHHVGPVESPLMGAVVQAYVYVPSLPEYTRVLQSVQGEVIAYQRASHVEFDVPLRDDLALPHTVEQDGIKVTLREFSVQGTTAEASLWVEGPSRSALVTPISDGTYGVMLYDGQERAASPAGGKLLQPRSNQLDYHVRFQRVLEKPGKLQLTLVHRVGPRRAYPFRLENIPLPYRTRDGRIEAGAAGVGRKQ